MTINKQDSLDAFITGLSNELRNNGVQVEVVREGETLNVYANRGGLMQWKAVFYYPDECCYLYYQVNQAYTYAGHVSTIPLAMIILMSNVRL